MNRKDVMIKPIAFYLPQFHPVEENSEWWGEGFTEWTNVAKATPNYEGHYQPHIPKHLGFYDLRLVDTMRDQADLAKKYGVHGFCFYHYWFNGRRVLDLPVNNFINSDIDMPFCLCWANENWTRRWDGKDEEVLLKQTYSAEDDLQFIETLIPLFKDERYIKVDGKPMLLIYRVELFPDIIQTAYRLRQLVTQAGFPDLHLCMVQSTQPYVDPKEYGFDAAVEFPPHGFFHGGNQPDAIPTIINHQCGGALMDYRKIVAQAIAKPQVEYTWYRGAMPSWDNTARRQNQPMMTMYAEPEEFQKWMTSIVQYTRDNYSQEHQFVFINAWNEWAEGAHLEPDLRYGLQWLEAVQRSCQSG